MRSPAFLLPHLGALIILAGALLTFIFGKNTQFNMPVTPDTFIDNVPAPDGSRWELGFRFSVTDFRVEYYTADNGSAQLLENAVPKDYEATIRIVPRNGNAFTCLLKVNRPVSYEGWRIYLISYGNDAEPYVQLLAKKDMGRGTVIAGIWMLIIGTFINCFKKKVHLTE
jgi:cytochrome c biogenesis protein ResB